jgi:hypothetical protein
MIHQTTGTTTTNLKETQEKISATKNGGLFKKQGFLASELKNLEFHWRYHRLGIMSFLGIFLSLWIVMTAWLWIPIFLFLLPTVFLPTFLIFNYTSILNLPLKIMWWVFFELMGRVVTRSDELDNEKH